MSDDDSLSEAFEATLRRLEHQAAERRRALLEQFYEAELRRVGGDAAPRAGVIAAAKSDGIDLDGLEESAYLLRSRINARRLMKSLVQGRRSNG